MKIKINQLGTKYLRFVMLTEYFLSLKSIQKLKSYQIKNYNCHIKRENYWLKLIKVDNSYYKGTLIIIFNKTNKFRYWNLNRQKISIKKRKIKKRL